MVTKPMVRNASPGDEAEVVALWRAAGLVADHNDPVADFRFALAGPASAVLIARDEGDGLVGAVMVGHDGHRGWLYYVATAPDRRSCGFGADVVGAAERWLRERGIRKVQLMVRPSNAGVTGFYDRMGYEETPRIVMAKWLT